MCCSGATGDDGFLNHVCHSGDGETHTWWGERFEHPTKTWACATHKQFTMQAVAVAIAKVKMAGNWEHGTTACNVSDPSSLLMFMQNEFRLR